MKVLITGGAGFIGSHTVDLCLAKGYDVFIIDNLSTGKRSNINRSYRSKNPENIDWDERRLFLGVEGDIKDLDFSSFPKVDVIIHLAAKANLQESLTNPVGSEQNNVMGTLRVLEYARMHDTPIVFVSSSAIYGDARVKPTDEANVPNPLSPYALQKLMGEQYLKLYHILFGLRSVAFRYFNVYGERQPNSGAYRTISSIFLRQYKSGKPFTIVGNGEQRRDFVYVKDVAEANVKAAEMLVSKLIKKETFNLGSGRNYSVNEIADMIDKNHPKVYLPKRIEPMETLSDCSKAKLILGWESKKELAKWFQSL